MISVIVVTRNRQSHLFGCLVSLSKQTRQPKEILVIDNASTDNTRVVVEEFSRKYPHIKYIYCSKLGIPYSRNMSVEKAKYDILACLDDDCNPDLDWYENIEKQAELANNYVLQGGAKNPNPTNVLSTTLFYLNQRFLNLELLISNNTYRKYKVIHFFDTKNFVIHKKHIKKVGHFLNEKHILAADLFFQKDLENNNIKILYLPGIDVYHSYMTNLFGYLNKIIWAKKCKQIFGSVQLIHTKKLESTKNLFGMDRVAKVQTTFYKKLKKINQDFFDTCAAKMNFPKKIMLKTTVFLTQLYLGDTI
ncbi:MAG: hypothetical protein BroJett025_10240 [Patescibacteria group bacterium]|nr:MAG: hypothetical protein BroJett025_10240 [Patescibacteria group bacterium]